MIHWTLRTRLMLWSALFFAAAAVLLGFFTISLVRKHQIESLDMQLREDARSVFHELSEHGPPGVTHSVLVVDKATRAVVLGADGKVIWASPELSVEDFAHTAPGAQTVGPWRVMSVSENGYTVRTVRGFQEVEATVDDVRRACLLALPVLLAFVGAGSWWLVSSALRPVQEMTSIARRVTAEHLDERLPLPSRRDELGLLTGVLNEMLERLDRSFRQSVRFTADASHEIKTPLALIAAGLEELLRRRDLPPEVVAAVASLLDDNRRLAAVCQDLLVLARADAGRLALESEPHDLCALVEAAVEDARILAEERALTFEVALPESATESVDARYLTRILLNLLSNAVKYNRAGGMVRVSLTADDRVWTLAIANTGPGIATAHQPKLFGRFFRAGRGSAEPGHGLGLSLSRELARAHSGELVLADSTSEWTIFRLTLPRIISSKGSSEPRSEASRGSVAGRTRLPRGAGALPPRDHPQ